MKIALCHNLPSGGARQAVWEFLRCLRQQHASIRFDEFYLQGADDAFLSFAPFVERQQVIPFALLPRVGRPASAILNPALQIAEAVRLRRAYARMAALVQAGGYDLVWAHNCRFGGPPGVLGALAGMSGAPPSAYYSHSATFPAYVHAEEANANGQNSVAETVGTSGARHNPLARFARQCVRNAEVRSYRAATRVLTNSEFLRQYLAETENVSAVVSPVGVDTEVFRPAEHGAAGSDGGDSHVLSVGALARHKGHDFVIRALGKIPAPQRPPLVILANTPEPPEQTRLAALAQQSGTQVRFLFGIRERALMRRQYQEAAFLVAGAHLEPLGLNVLEAMACGKPAVAVAEGGFRETIQQNETGLLCPRDETQFAVAVADLWQSTARRRALGARAREVARSTWNWDVATKKLLGPLEQTARGGLT